MIIFLLLLFPTKSSSLSFSYPTSITLDNGNIFVIHKTGIDIWLSYIAFIYGLEYKCSYELVKEKDYINKLFDRFEYKLEHKRMEELRKKTLDYLDRKVEE